MIDQETIQRIMDASRIEEVIGDFVSLKKRGANHIGCCPFHNEKTPSFYVSPSKGIYKCFGCGEAGDVVKFLMKHEHYTYPEALRWLAEKYHIEIREEELTEEQKERQTERDGLFHVSEFAQKYFADLLFNDEMGRAVGLSYFHQRGMSDEIIRRFGLGYCLEEWSNFTDYARKNGYSDAVLEKTGLTIFKDENGKHRVYDRFRGRAMFPWVAVNGKVVAFGGRVLDARTKGVNQKYVNSPDSIIYHKANELYGIFQAKKQIAKEDMVYMVEGYTDVLAMHQCGIENVVANSGTALNEAQIHLLHRFTNNITLLYDGDEAGIHAATRSTDMLLAEGMNVKILLLPDGDDPDSFSRKHNAQEFKEYVDAHQTDFILFKTNLLLKDAQRDPIKRAQLTEDIVKSIAVIPDEIIRSTYVHECAEILNMDEAVLMRGANKNRAAILENLKKEAQRERERQARLLEAGKESGNEVDESRAGEVKDVKDAADDSFASLTSESDTTQPPADIQPIATKQSLSEQRFIGLERMMMTLITRYGEQLIDGENGDGTPSKTSLAEYVQGDLEYDGITLRSPLYAKMLSLVCQHAHDEGFVASKFLINNQDEDISREAADLISDRYQLSKGNQMAQTEEELKVAYLTRLLLDYKNAIIEEEMKECNADLTRPEVKSDIELTLKTMRRIKELGDIQRQLAKMLGDRVVK